MHRLIQSVIASIIVGSIGVLIVFYVSGTNWSSPGATVRWMMVGAMLPAIIVGVLVALPQPGQVWTPRRILAAVVPGIVIGVVGVIVGSTWKDSRTRAEMLGWFGDERETLRLALDDPSGGVAWRACRQMIDSGLRDDRPHLLAVLTDRPDVAVKCLNEAKDGQTASDLSITLANRWHRQLVGAGPANMENADVEDVSCAAPEAVLRLPTSDSVKLPVVFSCALRSENPANVSCCTNIIAEKIGTGEELVSILDENFDVLERLDLIRFLVAATFGTGDLGRETATVAEELQLESEEARRTMLDMGCRSINSSLTPGEIIRHLAARTGRDDCGLNPVEVPQGVGSWQFICERITPQLEKQDGTSTGLLCEEVERQGVSEAVSAASELITKTLAGRALGGFTEKIQSGYAAQQASAASRFEFIDKLAKSVEDNPDATTEQRELLDAVRRMRSKGGDPGMAMFDQIGKIADKVDLSGMNASEEQREQLKEQMEKLEELRNK